MTWKHGHDIAKIRMNTAADRLYKSAQPYESSGTWQIRRQWMQSHRRECQGLMGRGVTWHVVHFARARHSISPPPYRKFLIRRV